MSTPSTTLSANFLKLLNNIGCVLIRGNLADFLGLDGSAQIGPLSPDLARLSPLCQSYLFIDLIEVTMKISLRNSDFLLWQTDEAVANRLSGSLEELEEALVERCVALCEQADLIWSHTHYHWWPDVA
jgi:hypothetical protein